MLLDLVARPVVGIAKMPVVLEGVDFNRGVSIEWEWKMVGFGFNRGLSIEWVWKMVGFGFNRGFSIELEWNWSVGAGEMPSPPLHIATCHPLQYACYMDSWKLFLHVIIRDWA